MDIHKLGKVHSLRVWLEKEARALMVSMSHVSLGVGGWGKVIYLKSNFTRFSLALSEHLLRTLLFRGWAQLSLSCRMSVSGHCRTFPSSSANSRREWMGHSLGTQKQCQQPAQSKICLWSLHFNLRIHVKSTFYHTVLAFMQKYLN